MKAAALVYLRDKVAAQRLAVAWPLVPDRTRGEKAVLRDWARVADVPQHQAEALSPVLRSHGICRDDGWVPLEKRELIGGSRKMVSYDDLEPSEKIRIYDKGITLKDAAVTSGDGNGNGKYAMLVGYRSGDVWAPQIALTEALSTEARHFVDCIANNLTPIADGHSGLRVVRMLEAATESMRASGRLIEFSSSRCAA